MELSKSQRNVSFAGCIVLVAVIQLLSGGISNIMSSILMRMDAMNYFAIQAVIASVGTAIMTPIGGRLGDIIGRRNVVLIGSILLLAGCFCMAPMNSFVLFMVGRVLASAGMGAFLSIPFALCADIFPRDQYAKKVGLLQAALAIGIVLGATIAGALNDMGLIAVAIIYPGVLCVIGALMIFTQIPNKKAENRAPVDVLGLVLISIFVAAISLSFSFGGRMGFLTPIILCGFGVAIVSFIILYRVEIKKAVPFIPFKLFRNIKFTGICFFTGFLAVYQAVMAMYVPLAGQQVMGLTSTVTGLFTLPRSILCIVLPSIVAVWVTKKSTRLRQAHMVSSGMVVLAFCGMVFISATSPIYLPFVLIALTGISEAFRAVSSNPMLVSLLDPKDIGIGIALNSTVGTLLASIGSSVLSAVYTPVASTNIPGALTLMFVITASLAFIALLIATFMLRDKKEVVAEA